ncbi:MAG: hypothetical protein ABTQ26_00175 [Azonexus sp.]
MSNVVIGWRNRMGSGATLTGGSWNAALPLNNLLTTERAEVARSTDALAASTQFNVDFGVARTIRTLALINHNLSQSATWRVKLGTASGAGDIYTSAYQAAWYIPFGTGAEEWESGAWWAPANDEFTGHPYMSPILLTTSYLARYMTIEILDTGNTAGYVQIGRVFAGEGFDPDYNPAYGLKQGWKDPSKVEVNDSGSPFFKELRRMRTVSFELPSMSLEKADVAWEMSRRSGTVKEIMYLPNKTDFQECQRYGFVGRFSDLQPQTYNFYLRKAQAFTIEEWL